MGILTGELKRVAGKREADLAAEREPYRLALRERA